MADGTKIEWTEATWNPITGCSLASPGCTNCYAMKLAGTRMRNHESRKGLTIDTKAGPVWNGVVRLNEQWLDQPLRWKRGRMIFVCAHGDLFHESVPDEWIDRVFAVMAEARHHIFQVLTKRSARMREYVTRRARLPDHIGAFYDLPTDGSCKIFQPLRSNIWLGVSVEDQARADERIPDLLNTPASVRWLSCEPLLGPLQIAEYMPNPLWNDLPSWQQPQLDWIVVGGESGPGARPMHPDWARSLRDQCARAEVPFLFKQWGAWAPLQKALPTLPGSPGMVAWPDGRIGIDLPKPMGTGTAMFAGTKKVTGRLLDGVQHDGYPQ